jgi:predicted unusual protein kinase regulating ubiquinone biosynthesis (AarF/ABC1/UbiB family)
VAIGAVLGAFSVMVLPPLLARPLLGIQAGPLRIALYVAPGPGTGGPRHELLAQELRQALQAGGTTFVKLGQLMSTRRDLLPAPYIGELSRLQDQVPPAPWAEVEAALLAGLGAPPQEVFAEFAAWTGSAAHWRRAGWG